MEQAQSTYCISGTTFGLFNCGQHNSSARKLGSVNASGMSLQVQEQAEQDCPFVFLDKARWEMAKAKWRRFQQEGIERKWDSKQLHGRLLAQFKRQCRMAGIKTVDKLTVHSMRKSWACNLADNSVPIHTLMKLGGWSSIETCQQYYLQSTDENEKKAIEGLERMVRG